MRLEQTVGKPGALWQYGVIPHHHEERVKLCVKTCKKAMSIKVGRANSQENEPKQNQAFVWLCHDSIFSSVRSLSRI